MKKIYFLLLALLCLGTITNAQVASYVFSQSSGTFTPITGGTVLATQTVTSGTAVGALDDVAYTTTLPFAFRFNGTNYASGATVNVSSNGFISFATLATGDYTPISTSTGTNVIAGMGFDCNGGYAAVGSVTSGSDVITGIANTGGFVVGTLVSGTGIPTGSTILSVSATSITISASATATGATTTLQSAGGEIRSQQVGSSFVIQFKNMRRYNTTLNSLTYQIILNSSSNTVSFVYGNVINAGTSTYAPQVGLRGTANTDFNSRTGTDWTASTASAAATNTMTLGITGGNTVPASGLTYTWTPPAPPAIDVALASINLQPGLCPVSASPVTATIVNRGGVVLDFAASNTTITVNITGASTQTLTGTVTSGTLAVDSSLVVSLTPNAVFTASGSHALAGSVTVAGDANATNNTATATKTVATSTTSPMFQPFATTTTPTGWTTTGWTIGSTRGATGNPGNNIYKNLYSGATTGTFSTINIGPLGSNDQLSLDYKLSNYSSPYAPPAGNWGNFLVQVSIDCGVTYNTIATVNSAAVATWTTQNYSLAAYSGMTIAVRISATWAAGDYDLAFDNINVSPAPACPAPSGVTVSNVTSSSAGVSFSGTGTYILEYGPAGFVPGTGASAGGGTIINNAVSVQTINGLASETAYDVYIRRNCSATGDGFSVNSSVVAFTTLQVQLLSVASGNWNAASTWAGGVIPTCADNVSIQNGHTVTISSVGNVSRSISIVPGATLTVASGDIAVGCTNRNAKLINDGAIIVSGGTLNINGSLLNTTQASFSQSGGNINVDGNNGGIATGSVATGTRLVDFQTNSLTNISFTGGVFTVVDPHISATALGSEAIYVNGSVIGPLVSTTDHTFRFGDGVSTDAGGSSAGFGINLWQDETGLAPGNIIVEGPSGTNRFVQSVYQLTVAKNVTVNNGGEIRTGSIYLGGDLTANAGGIVTTIGTSTTPTIYLVNPSFSTTTSGNLTLSNVTIPQTVGGAGTFRNSATATTASTRNFTVQNTSAGGVTLSSPFSVGVAFALTAGVVNTTATNLLTVGVSGTATGSITRTAGYVNGPVKKWYAAATGSATFPLGGAGNYKPATVNFTAAPTAGTLTATFITTAPDFPNVAPLMEGALVVNKASNQGYWTIEAGDGLTGGTYTATLTGNGSMDVLDFTKTVLIKRPSAGGDWTLDGTHVTSTGSNTAPVVSRTGMTGFSQFAIGGEGNVALPVGIEYFSGAKQLSGNILTWKVNCTTSPNAVMVLERSTDGVRFTSINSRTESALRCLQPFDYMDAAPVAGINYYRLKTIDADGKVSYSTIVAILNKDKGTELISMIPNPVRAMATLSIASASVSKMDIIVSDVSGKQVLKQSVVLGAGSNTVPLNLAHLAAGTYQVTGYTAEGKVKTMRFVKQ